MKLPQGMIDAYQSLTVTSFEHIREKELKPEYSFTGLRYLRDRCRNERDLRDLYKGRAPYELLQNADDAGAKTAVFILSPHGMAFAHDGKWFTVSNFRSLADGWSDKDPNQCIGHKGLGFRSVLGITPSPYVIQITPDKSLAIKFSWALNNGYIHETLHKNPALDQHYREWTKTGQSICPVMCIPALVPKQKLGTLSGLLDKLIGGIYGKGLSSLFWFPAGDADIDAKVLADLRPVPIIADGHGLTVMKGFLQAQVSGLLPFLENVERVELFDGATHVAGVYGSQRPGVGQAGEINVKTSLAEEVQTRSFFQMRFSLDIPPEIREHADTPKAVRAMSDADIVLSVELRGGQPVHNSESCYHVYFPTEERIGAGFVIHGDFHVKPDRTRLMDSKYNDWLLRCAARKTANELLTELLKRYQARSIFAALSPTPGAVLNRESDFTRVFADEIAKRQSPFIPTRNGLAARNAVVLPPEVDSNGVWERLFASFVKDAEGRTTTFLAPHEDGTGTRAFLRLAGILPLPHERLLTFVQVAGRSPQTCMWWYECYSLMANDKEIAGRSHPAFVGCRLIPTEQSVLPVSSGQSAIVCMPPPDDTLHLPVPDCFNRVFTFVKRDVAEQLTRGDSKVRTWVLDRLGIAAFEATDLLPRAIRTTAGAFFEGKSQTTAYELAAAWAFMEGIIRGGRAIVSADFWRDIGRFPLPCTPVRSDAPIAPVQLVPAFLVYWPQGELLTSCLEDVANLRRLDGDFFAELVAVSHRPRSEWTEFLGKAGVSSSPKLLNYRRPAVGVGLLLDPGALDSAVPEGFSGERQNDENKAVLEILRREGQWPAVVASSPRCNHEAMTVLQSLAAIDGFVECVQAAQHEYAAGNQHWQDRLWRLAVSLPAQPLANMANDTAWCRGGGPGGHTINIGCYVKRQLEHHPWLPSSAGPVGSHACFLRQAGRRLISSGRNDEELGDMLLPYVTVRTLEEMIQLQQLGVAPLEDAASSSAGAIVRALELLGEKLATPWGQKEILTIRSRWRFVRGAIQEMYRALNQQTSFFAFPSAIKLVCRSTTGPTLAGPPFYFAEPGSAVERAFLDSHSLLDTDRVYRQLFDASGITHLQAGDTVEETFLSESVSVEAPRLKDIITNGLAPFLLATVIAKSEQPKHAELVVRRLRDRFHVLTTPRLEAEFTLISDPATKHRLEFAKFYLKTDMVKREGAVEEAHYLLYVKGATSTSYYDLDADALGEVIAQLFLDGIGKELAPMFPRIASRFHSLSGRREDLETFIHLQLGVSPEALDYAEGLLSGEVADKVDAPPSPMPKIVPPPPVSQDTSQGSQQITRKVTDTFKKVAEDLTQVLIDAPGPDGEHHHDRRPPAFIPEVTPEQELRGRLGEEEIKRRLEQPGGWAGLTLVSDNRKVVCGYDFLCGKDGQQVEVEVKTFVRHGRVVVSTNELREAARKGKNYYLLGVLESDAPRSDWQTVLVQDPFSTLMANGELTIHAKLEAPAASIFRDL